MDMASEDAALVPAYREIGKEMNTYRPWLQRACTWVRRHVFASSRGRSSGEAVMRR